MEGEVHIKYHGTIVLEVDSQKGRKNLTLLNVLLIESLSFNILSLQKLLSAKLIYTFNLVPGKVVIQKSKEGVMVQVALMT